MTLRLPRTFRAAPALLALLLSACATMSELPSGAPAAPPSADSMRAEQLYRDGEFDRAAEVFIDLANRSRGDASAHYQLRAAESLRENGNLDGAAQLASDIRRRRLHGDDSLRLDLLGAEIALKHGDAEQARMLAAFNDTMPPDLRLRAMELRARADAAAGDAFASAQTRAQLDRQLTGVDREQNRQHLLETLGTLDADALKSRFDNLQPNDPLRPWIEQAMRKQGLALARDLPRPSQPVGTLRQGSNGMVESEGYQPPRRVALLLPLNAQLASVANAIRDGFLAAWFTDAPERRPELRILDAGKTPEDAIAAYDRAVAEGADRVVGPLQRESVGALFHRPLDVRVLALNHPDTGEVPPPGSAEYGLLPEAEGVQVAEHLRARGIGEAAVITAEADWAERAARAFRAQFEAGGGIIVGESRIRDKEVNYATAVTQASANLKPEGGVFISMRPQQARLLVPQLKVAGVMAPVFATSHIYSGDDNATLDRDLDGVEFCDAPWLFGPMPGKPERARIAGQIPSASGVGARLFAFGMDAYALLPYVEWLVAHPDSYLSGATGELTADNFGRVHRLVSWARFQNGIAQPADGALSATPMP